MLNYDPKKDIINPKRCQICVQRLEEKKSDVIFPNLSNVLIENLSILPNDCIDHKNTRIHDLLMFLCLLLPDQVSHKFLNC